MRKQLAAFLSHLRNEKNVSPNTERSYRSDLEQLAEVYERICAELLR